jgi:uncharacterized protein
MPRSAFLLPIPGVGGLVLGVFAATGRFDVRSPGCRIYRTIHPVAVRWEGMRLPAFGRTA